MSKLSDSIGQFATIPFTVIKMIPVIGADSFTLFSYLRYRTNGESGKAFPSYETIQNDIGFNPRKIAKCLRILEANGLMTRHKRFGNSTEYTLICPDAQSLPISSTVLPTGTVKSYQRGKTNYIDINQIDSTKIDLGADEPRRKPAIQKSIHSIKETVHPSIAVFREVRRSYPSKELYAMIISAVGDTPDKLDLWRRILIGYTAMGWNPRNVAGALEYFGRGEVPTPKTQHAISQANMPPTDRGVRSNISEMMNLVRVHGNRLASDQDD